MTSVASPTEMLPAELRALHGDVRHWARGEVDARTEGFSAGSGGLHEWPTPRPTRRAIAAREYEDDGLQLVALVELELQLQLAILDLGFDIIALTLPDWAIQPPREARYGVAAAVEDDDLLHSKRGEMR